MVIVTRSVSFLNYYLFLYLFKKTNLSCTHLPVDDEVASYVGPYLPTIDAMLFMLLFAIHWVGWWSNGVALDSYVQVVHTKQYKLLPVKAGK